MGTFNVIQQTAPLFSKNEPDGNGLRGVIINTSGIEADRGSSAQVAIAASAGAINNMTRPIAADFADQGIRVVTISPAFMGTPLNEYVIKEVGDAILDNNFSTPIRFADPDAYAHLVQSIVGNPSINAVTIEVSGGAGFTF